MRVLMISTDHLMIDRRILQEARTLREAGHRVEILAGFECRACGRPYQIWDRIEGRLQEFIVTRGGRWISMTAINFSVFPCARMRSSSSELR